MRKIIYTRPDGGVSVVHPAESEQLAWDRLPKDAINPRWADVSEIPSDRSFRDAWVDSGGVNVDMPKAREIHKESLRRIRAPLFEPIERAQRTALAAGNTTQAQLMEAKLQALRDMTADPVIEAAMTPEELKVAIPDVLRIAGQIA